MKIYRRRRLCALALAHLMVLQIVQVPIANAITSGPSQPEFSSFEPVGTTDMVNLFTGDFSYNIPLFELPGPNGGYPFNLSYQSGAGLDDEASWTGLGWNLNPGSISRQVRGLPDEFKGDAVHTTMSIEPSITAGVSGGGNLEFLGSDKIRGGINFSVFNNNYKGVGYSIDGDVGFRNSASGSTISKIGLGFSLNPDEGIGLNPSIGLDSKMGAFGLSAGYHSRSGLSSASMDYDYVGPKGTGNEGIMNQIKNRALKSLSASSSISFSYPGYFPQVSLPMRNKSLKATFKVGAQVAGLFGNVYVSGFYNEGRLLDDGKRVPSQAFGYLHYQDVGEERFIMDFNREKDGLIRKETPNLPVPSLTYDIYTVMGQDINAMYRPFRNDFGIVRDYKVESLSADASGGGDGGLKHIGANLEGNFAVSTSGAWLEDAPIANTLRFSENKVNDLFEPWYFGAHGEHVGRPQQIWNGLGGEKAVKVSLTGTNKDAVASGFLESRSWRNNAPSHEELSAGRNGRNQAIHPFTNRQILQEGEEIMENFKVEYLDKNGGKTGLDRTGLPDHHVAGYTALNAEGLQYTYALPVYNHHHEEMLFSSPSSTGTLTQTGNNGGDLPDYKIGGTEKFLKKTEIPKYAYAYLLTSIVGPDYIDLTGNGITEDDLGYWVKFTYKQITSEELYKWRDPFSKAHYQEGFRTDQRDDKGSFTYGEKEIWYLAQAETKSHIARFNLSDREDARGVQQKLQDTDLLGQKLKRLQEIVLFTREGGESRPIRKVKFEYDYSLCQGLPNHTGNGGKLTLKKLWFEYGRSNRGSLNPYEFSYSASNPDYLVNAYDRWGNYKPYPQNDPMINRDLPYVDQDPEKKTERDSNAGAWSLAEIRMPSGGKIKVDYESDDYAFVQHKQAMQMVKAVSPHATPLAELPGTYTLNDEMLKIRFPLERHIPGSLNVQEQREEVLKYLDTDRGQLFFKLFINLRASGENFFEYIKGYADLDMGKEMALEKDASGDYAYGTFYVKEEKGHHPFSVRAWQHLRVNQPYLANIGKKIQPQNTKSQKINQIKALPGLIPQIRQIFEGYNNYCNGKGFGKEIDGERSVIRLKSPDKVKYGGGVRVRQVTTTDEWAFDEEGIYGLVYDYTKNEKGDLISSGVAAYEPFIGGEENVLRYAKKYSHSIPLISENNLFFEYPVNESYYPGPQVGYSKVTVMSLAAAHKAGKEVKNITLSDGKALFPSGSRATYGTTGASVHEFYTARDYPVRSHETEKSDKPFIRSNNILFLGSVHTSRLTSSQGYSIITNDMHGKQKRVSHFRQRADGSLQPDPISWVKYNYFSKPLVYEREQVQSLSNTFNEDPQGYLVKAGPGDGGFTLGQEIDFFADMREHKDLSTGVGGNVNLDIILALFFPVPIPTYWPNVTRNENRLRTVVTNKVIFQSGILESTEAYDEGSLITTRDVKWDKETGNPLLTLANNNFDDPIYNLTLPAFHQYAGMGGAYRNLGYTFSMDNLMETEKEGHYAFHVEENISDPLFTGDELIIYDSDNGLLYPLGKAIYLGKENGKNVFFSEVSIPVQAPVMFNAKVVRSGYKNLLGLNTGGITSLEDPTVQSAPKNRQVKIIKPQAIQLN